MKCSESSTNIKTEMTYITRNERGDFIIDFIEIKRTIKEYHDQS